MGIKTSVLIPSKGSPRNVVLTICNLVSMAARPDDLEFIVVIDHLSPESSHYRRATDSLWELGINCILLHATVAGYKNIAAMFEEAYQQSTGDLLMFYNDDARILTRNWDAVYADTLFNIPFGVASAFTNEGEVTPGGGVGHYPWAFPVVRRDLCYACGNKLIVDITETGLDRIFEAYARKTGHAKQAAVLIEHSRTMLVPGSEREAHYKDTEANWAAYMARWDAVAQRMQDAVHHVEITRQNIAWPGVRVDEQLL
jgi:hypothetical protein